MMRAVFALFLMSAACFPAMADVQQSPVIYSRTVLKILPAPGSALPVKAEAKPKADDARKPVAEPVATSRITKSYMVDVRPPEFLAQHDFIAHQPFTDKGGMLILIDPPAVTTLKSSNLLGNVDVLFVAPDGLIVKIMPNLSLPALEEPISSGIPVRAFVFLKGQTAAEGDIQPGDRIDNPLFKAHPVVLDEAAPPKK